MIHVLKVAGVALLWLALALLGAPRARGQEFTITRAPEFSIRRVEPLPAKEPVKSSALSFEDGAALAVQQDRPLIVFVGVPPRAVPDADAIVCTSSGLDGQPEHCIIVAVRRQSGDGVKAQRVLPADATNFDIRRALPSKEVSLPARPFGRSWPLPSARHDADLNATGPWPDGLDMPKNLRRYRRASMTQDIAVLNDRDRITPAHRLGVKSKWHQSGGMEGIDGWQSDLYKNDVAAAVRHYVADIQVWNGSNFQPNRGWRRQYDVGSLFLDVLSTDKGVFEVRQLEKKTDGWRPSILYRNVDNRPEGYAGIGARGLVCTDCHNHRPGAPPDDGGAGSGGYATGLVPGGDVIISDPIPALER